MIDSEMLLAVLALPRRASGSDCIGRPVCGYVGLLLVGQVFNLPAGQDDRTFSAMIRLVVTFWPGRLKTCPTFDDYFNRISTLAL